MHDGLMRVCPWIMDQKLAIAAVKVAMEQIANLDFFCTTGPENDAYIPSFGKFLYTSYLRGHL